MLLLCYVGPIAKEKCPTLAWTLVRQQLEALSTATFKAANGVPAVVVTAAVMKFTLINVWETEKDQITLQNIDGLISYRVNLTKPVKSIICDIITPQKIG